MDTFSIIIAVSAIIILSFFFNIFSARTKIPSVLLLMGLGVGLQEWITDSEKQGLGEVLPILGNVGLIMIVLEAALELELERKKLGVILKSFAVATITLAASSIILAYLIQYLLPAHPPFIKCLVYAVPLSIMSSAIIIPSVASLSEQKKEFMVYESTFSDILGIMYFYFLVGSKPQDSTIEVIGSIAGSIAITLLLAGAVAYGLVYLFQHLKTQVKLFLIIAVLMLMYGIGKYYHLSSLIIILAFGLVLNNTNVFFRGRLNKYVNEEATKPIMHDFHTLTLETAFVIRTFFFVIFGITIQLSSLIDQQVAIISFAIIGTLLLIRGLALFAVVKRNLFPKILLAPRGLITILLYFSILSEHQEFIIPSFDPGILLYTIIVTSIIMAAALVMDRGERIRDVVISNIKDNLKDLVELPKNIMPFNNMHDERSEQKRENSEQGRE